MLLWQNQRRKHVYLPLICPLRPLLEDDSSLSKFKHGVPAISVDCHPVVLGTSPSQNLISSSPRGLPSHPSRAGSVVSNSITSSFLVYCLILVQLLSKWLSKKEKVKFQTLSGLTLFFSSSHLTVWWQGPWPVTSVQHSEAPSESFGLLSRKITVLFIPCLLIWPIL